VKTKQKAEGFSGFSWPKGRARLVDTECAESPIRSMSLPEISVGFEGVFGEAA